MFQQVRKIKPTRRSVSGFYPFRDTISIPYESSLERDFIIIQEFDKDVRDLVAQPVSIPFHLKGRTYTYTPDFLVLLNNNKGILAEVKPNSEWRSHWRSWLPKWKAAYRWANDRQFTFHIFDESRIRGSLFNNIQLLNTFKRNKLGEEEISFVKTVIGSQHMRISDYLTRCPSETHDQQYLLICTMLAHGILQTDFYQPITPTSHIWISQ